jgi:hypothetical protein
VGSFRDLTLWRSLRGRLRRPRTPLLTIHIYLFSTAEVSPYHPSCLELAICASAYRTSPQQSTLTRPLSRSASVPSIQYYDHALAKLPTIELPLLSSPLNILACPIRHSGRDDPFPECRFCKGDPRGAETNIHL